MYKKMFLVILVSFLFTGCASVPMASKERSNYAKEFNPPADGKTGLYIYKS